MKKNSSAGENGDSPSIKSGVAPLCRKAADGRKIISGKSSLFDPRSSDRPKFLYRHCDNANKNAHSEDTEEDSLETELGDVFDLASVSRVLDKFFFLWHTSMMMACLALVIVGVVLRFHFTSIVLSSVKKNVYYHEYEKFVAFRSAPKELNFGNLTQTLGNALMILNALHILCIMMYMSFQIHRNHFTLPVVCFLSGIVVILEINTTHVYMSTNSAPIKKAMKELTNKINSSYAVEDSNVISVTHDIFAIWGHCCGVQELYDFQDMSLSFSAKRDKERSPIAYPPTCCNETKYKQYSEAADKSLGFDTTIKQCAMLGDGVYGEGCFLMLFNWLNMFCVLYSSVIMGQLFDIFIHLALYNKMVLMFAEVFESRR